MGGYFGGTPTSQETPDVQTSSFEYADGTVLEFGTRGEDTNDEGTRQDRQPVLRDRGLAVDRRRRPQVAVVSRAEGREGPGRRRARDERRQRPERAHQHRVRRTTRTSSTRIRAGDPKILTCDILEGHLSSTLPHLANIAYLTKQSLEFDGDHRDVQERQGRRQAPHARVPQGLRGAGQDVGVLRTAGSDSDYGLRSLAEVVVAVVRVRSRYPDLQRNPHRSRDAEINRPEDRQDDCAGEHGMQMAAAPGRRRDRSRRRRAQTPRGARCS